MLRRQSSTAVSVTAARAANFPLLIASETQTFTPEAAREQGKAVVLIQACIHSGEPDGKDAGFALLRDIAITKTAAGILENVVLLFMPIYNTDGHERSTPFNRINQNGPESMGWRTTSTYQNLNRDYMKADTPETRAWLRLWNEWDPHLFIDCHVTDGADYRCNITFHHEHHAGVDNAVLEWERDVFDNKVAQATEAAGNVISWYLEFIDNRDLNSRHSRLQRLAAFLDRLCAVAQPSRHSDRDAHDQGLSFACDRNLRFPPRRANGSQPRSGSTNSTSAAKLTSVLSTRRAPTIRQIFSR